jgi:membrane-bound serine protease (ClpP class)
MIEVFFILLIIGLILVGAEIFIPGGILGTIGGLALLGSVIIAFANFPAPVAIAIAGGIVILVGIAIALWLKFFPRTWVGRKMMVSEDLHDSTGTQDGLSQLVGKTGVAISPLHPGGFAEIEGRRVDVVTQGEMIDKGTSISVIEVESNRVVVVAQDA